MKVATDVWAVYDRWNSAISDSFFNSENADLPAYIDADNSRLNAVAESIGIDKDGLDALVSAARATLELNTTTVFHAHTVRLTRWRRDLRAARQNREQFRTPPPIVALLLIFTLAAERMGADSNFAPNAYYPRLEGLLDLGKSEAPRFRHSFPTTEDYWGALNEFLVLNEGQLGLPTAFALTWRFVGLPQSQALVRAHDRAKLPGFYRMFGLSPGSELIGADLERLLDLWVTSSPPPTRANLRNLWMRNKARRQIADVVALELSHWDGSFTAKVGAETSPSDVQLTALIRKQLGQAKLELSFLARLDSQQDSVDELTINSADGSPRLGVVPAAGGRLRPAPWSHVDSESLVIAILDFSPVGSDTHLRRLPRAVVPLRKDDLLGIFVETERVLLADDTIILVKDDPLVTSKLFEILGQYGRYGTVYSEVASEGRISLTGLPADWLLIDDVQLFATPPTPARFELNVLIPLTTAQLNLSGGLKMPGRVPKWSSLRPPEIRAAVAEAKELKIVLRSLDDDPEGLILGAWSENGAAIIVPLDELDLEDGDYEIELLADGNPIRRPRFRLRSADSPDLVSWENCERLMYEIEDVQRSTVSATAIGDAIHLCADGPAVLGHPHSNSVETKPTSPWRGWARGKSNAEPQRSPTIVLGKPDPKSCVITGAHYLEFPVFMGGRPHASKIDGVCKYCGLVKRLPARPQWKKTGGNYHPPAPSINLDRLSKRTDEHINWDAALDSLIHVGGGSIGSLERIALQTEGSSLFVDQFTRDLESIGHINVCRDEQFQATAWEATPPYLAGLVDGTYLLTGAWSSSARSEIARLAEDTGSSFTCEHIQGTASRWILNTKDAAIANLISQELELFTNQEVPVLEECAKSLLSALTPISRLETELTVAPIPQYKRASIFDLSSASWKVVAAVTAPGAYRLEQSFRTINLWIDELSLADRVGRLASVQLVKHLAAMHGGSAITQYDAQRRTFAVPLGADLPGLYGRVATLCSGRPPLPVLEDRALAYQTVPANIADGLTALMQM